MLRNPWHLTNIGYIQVMQELQKGNPSNNFMYCLLQSSKPGTVTWPGIAIGLVRYNTHLVGQDYRLIKFSWSCILSYEWLVFCGKTKKLTSDAIEVGMKPDSSI